MLWLAAADQQAKTQNVPVRDFRFDKEAAIAGASKEAAKLSPRLGVNIHFLKDDRALDLAKVAGFSFVRTDLPWARLEKQGSYDFAPFDGLMRSLEARGMGVLWLLAYGHPEHGGKSPQSSEDIEAYARYAAAVVTHFRGRNVRFEIWNEPNAKEFLPNPAIYPDLLRATLELIRHKDPTAMVSTGGTSGFDFPFLAAMLKSGAARKASAVAVHPYRDSGPETTPADMERLRQLMQHNSLKNTPVWVTEWGYSSYDGPSQGFADGGHSEAARKRQAVLVARECLTMWTLGLPVIVLYDLRDDGANPFNREHNFGLLNQGNSDKPAMKAVKALTSVARDHTFSGTVRRLPHGLHAIRLDAAEDVVFILWNDDAQLNFQIHFSPDDSPSICNIFGEPIAIEGNERVLEEDAGPIYVRLKRTSSSVR
ncbi:MAG TPA: cellulase family glycosylhydrolase [Bryobacteraceae bacterium]|nr:cellulase family glycosylhydrolase [Bryobacteraceae bacterium]